MAGFNKISNNANVYKTCMDRMVYIFFDRQNNCSI